MFLASNSGRLKPVFTILLLFAFLGGAAAQDASSSRLKVVHLSPGAPDLDVFVDGEEVSEGLGFGESTGYIALEPGTYEVAVAPAGEGLENDIETTTISLEEGQSYMITLSNRALNPELGIISVEESRPPSDSSRVRVAQFSPDMLTIDASVENGRSVRINDVSYQQTGSYHQVPRGEYTVTVSRPMSPGFTDTVSLEGGTGYTLFVAGLRKNFQVIPVKETVARSRGSGNGNGEEIVLRCVRVSE